MNRKTRQDYRKIHRKMLQLLENNHRNLQIPYFPGKRLTNKDLASNLNVNEKTIRRHKKAITEKQWQKIKSFNIADLWGCSVF